MNYEVEIMILKNNNCFFQKKMLFLQVIKEQLLNKQRF